jgi:hypothetical protein
MVFRRVDLAGHTQPKHPAVHIQRHDGHCELAIGAVTLRCNPRG